MGVMLINPENDEILVAIKLDFPTTNNEAEYEAILAGLGAKSLDIRNDSQVVVGHVDGTFEAKGENMIKYLPKVLEFHEYLDRVATTQIPRA